MTPSLPVEAALRRLFEFTQFLRQTLSAAGPDPEASAIAARRVETAQRARLDAKHKSAGPRIAGDARI